MAPFYKFICYDYCTNEGKVIKPRTSTFMKYSSSIVIIDDEFIPGASNGEMCSLFSSSGRDLFINALQLFKYMFDADKCLPKFNPDKILVMLDEGNVLKLAQDVTLVTATSALIDMNLAMLGQMFNKVLSKYPNRLEEINDLLLLLKANGSQNLDLIYIHSCWTDICEKKDLFVRLHNFFITRVKPRNIQDYEDILKDVVFPINWEQKVEVNPNLRRCYNARNTQYKNKRAKKKRTVNGQASSSTVPTQSVQRKSDGNQNLTASSSTVPTQSVQRKSDGNQNLTGRTGVQNGPLPRPDATAVANAAKKNSSSYTASPGNGPLPTLDSVRTKNLRSSTAGTACPAVTACYKKNSTSYTASPLPGLQKNDLQSSIASTAASSKKDSTGYTAFPQTGLLPKVVRTSASGKTCPDASDSNKNSPSCSTISASRSVPKKNTRNNVVQSSPVRSTPGSLVVNNQAAQAADPKYNAPGSNPAEEVMSYYRNAGTHGMEDSLKKKFERYNFRQLNIMLVDLLPSLCSSLMYALYKRGYLTQIDIPKILK